MTTVPDRIQMIPTTAKNAASAWRSVASVAAVASVAFLALSAISSVVCAQPPSGTTTLVYEFSRSGLKLAEMTDTLKVEGSRYELTSNATGVGIVAVLARGQSLRRESRGAIAATGLAPQSFTEQRGDNYKLTAEF